MKNSIKTQTKNAILDILRAADVEIDGTRPWDIQVHNENRFYRTILSMDTIKLGESYMVGDFDCDRLDQLIAKLIGHKLYEYVINDKSRLFHLLYLRTMNQGRPSKAFEVGHKHYNLGNDLYKAMLDKRLVYTCGYWKDAKTLDEAQEAKLDLICQKIGLKPGMSVLDIGGGWGSFAKFAAEKYGVSVVNIGISQEQINLANELCKGLPVENRLMDYRKMTGQFDCIVSIGMFEHVGRKNYRTYFKVANRCLKDDGLFLLHTMGGVDTPAIVDPWIAKYIFPNAELPSVYLMGKAIDQLFIMEDWHNFGTDYATTLRAWHTNFEKHWPSLKHNYDEQFYRMWRFYLLTVAGAFDARMIDLWQIVLSKKGIIGGYQSIR